MFYAVITNRGKIYFDDEMSIQSIMKKNDIKKKNSWVWIWDLISEPQNYYGLVDADKDPPPSVERAAEYLCNHFKKLNGISEICPRIYIARKGYHSHISSPHVIVRGTAHVFSIDGNSFVHKVYGRSIIDQIKDQVFVEEVADKATIKHAFSRSRINNIHDFATIECLRGHSCIHRAYEGAKIIRADQNSCIFWIEGYAHISCVDQTSTVTAIDGSASIDEVTGGAFVRVVGENVTIKDARRSSIIVSRESLGLELKDNVVLITRKGCDSPKVKSKEKNRNKHKRKKH